MLRLILLVMISSTALAGEITSTPQGINATYDSDKFKVVSKESVCTEKEPCEDKKPPIKKQIEKLHEKLRCTCPVCPIVEPVTRVIYVDKPAKTVTVEKEVIKEVTTKKHNIVRAFAGFGPDGLDFGKMSDDEYYFAETHVAPILGAGYTRFFDSNVGIGVQVFSNKSLTSSVEYAF